MSVSVFILPTLLSIFAIIFLALGIYGGRVLKDDWALATKTSKTSVQRPTLIGVCAACIIYMGALIMIVLQSSGIISDEQTLNIVGIVSLPLIVIGASMLGFSLFRVTIQSVLSVALVESGIAATRNKWLKFLQKYGMP